MIANCPQSMKMAPPISAGLSAGDILIAVDGLRVTASQSG